MNSTMEAWDGRSTPGHDHSTLSSWSVTATRRKVFVAGQRAWRGRQAGTS